MSNYVIKYSRDDRVKYISHLDFMRFIHRTIRRTDLEMEFSKGFNPHPIMTVAMPLSVGVTADGELMKIAFKNNPSSETIKNTLNSAMPDGFKIIAVSEDTDKKYDFNKIDRAEYEVSIETTSKFDISEFMKNDSLIVPKKTKSGIKESDIRPFIYNIKKIQEDENGLKLNMVIASGNNYNLKPETVLDAMHKYQNFKYDFFIVHRKKLLSKEKELF